MYDTALSQIRSVHASAPGGRYETAHFRLAPQAGRPPQAFPGIARGLVAERLPLWGLTAVVEDAKLVTSELVTNAVQHATPCAVGVALRYAPGLLRIEVGDNSCSSPVPRCARPDEENGRGLLLVRELCEAWGYERHAGGTKIIWCSLRAEPGGSR